VLQIVKKPTGKQANPVDPRFKLLTKVKREKPVQEAVVEETKKETKRDPKKKEQEQVLEQPEFE